MVSKKFFALKKGRIGSSEIFTLVQYYLSDQELLNFGIQPTSVRGEEPFRTAFYLYHKVRGTLPKVIELTRAMGDFGLAAEYVAEKWMKEQGYEVSRPEQVVVGNRVASADFMVRSKTVINQDGVIIPPNTDFIVENKTFVPQMLKKVKAEGIPFKYICQLQYQLWLYDIRAGAFSSLELCNDTADERAYIAGVFAGSTSKGLKQFYARFTKSLIFMECRQEFGPMFDLVLSRFFADVNTGREPRTCLADDPSMLFALLRIDANVQEAPAATLYESTVEAYEVAKHAYQQAKICYDIRKKNIVDVLYQNRTLTGITNEGKKKVIVQGNNSIKVVNI